MGYTDNAGESQILNKKRTRTLKKFYFMLFSLKKKLAPGVFIMKAQTALAL